MDDVRAWLIMAVTKSTIFEILVFFCSKVNCCKILKMKSNVIRRGRNKSSKFHSYLGPLLSENVSCSGCSSWTSSPKETTPSWPASRRHNALLIKATDSKANSLERLSAILIDKFKRKLLVWCLKYPFQSNGETHNGTKVKIGKGNKKKAANLPGRIVNGQYNLIIPLSWLGPAQPDPIFTELAGDIRYHFAHIQAFARSVVSLRRKKKEPSEFISPADNFIDRCTLFLRLL